MKIRRHPWPGTAVLTEDLQDATRRAPQKELTWHRGDAASRTRANDTSKEK